MKLRLGISPCPNDTFIFDAMLHHKIDTEGLEFEVVFSDVEELNKFAFQSGSTFEVSFFKTCLRQSIIKFKFFFHFFLIILRYSFI